MMKWRLGGQTMNYVYTVCLRMKTSIAFAIMVALSLVFGVPASSFAAVGCVHDVTGVLRIVTSPSDCRPSESPIGVGSPATSFTTTVAQGSTSTLVDSTTLNGVTVTGRCEARVNLKFSVPAADGHSLLMSGTRSEDGLVEAAPTDITSIEISGRVFVNINVIAADSAVGPFARIDVNGLKTGPSGDCSYFGMIIPSS